EKNQGVIYTTSIQQHLEPRFNVQHLWEKIARLIKQVTNSLKYISIDFIGVSSLLRWVVLDKEGEPVDLAWNWKAHGDNYEVQKSIKIFGDTIKNNIGRELSNQLGVFYWKNTIKN